jgi:hypothetical protein
MCRRRSAWSAKPAPSVPRRNTPVGADRSWVPYRMERATGPHARRSRTPSLRSLPLSQKACVRTLRPSPAAGSRFRPTPGRSGTGVEDGPGLLYSSCGRVRPRLLRSTAMKEAPTAPVLDSEAPGKEVGSSGRTAQSLGVRGSSRRGRHSRSIRRTRTRRAPTRTAASAPSSIVLRTVCRLTLSRSAMRVCRKISLNSCLTRKCR